MLGDFVSFNGHLIPKDDAKISIDDIEWTYGFGVYENIRLANGTIYFPDEHITRLFHSAATINLPHELNEAHVMTWMNELIAKNDIQTANIKMLLIGGNTASDARLFIFLLAPKFPEKTMYRDGVVVITERYERFLPQAKTLNMLPSYLAYKKAQTTGAFDTLYINREGCILEGTRSNFFAMKGMVLMTPPEASVLSGVTRNTVIDCAKKHGYTVEEREIPLADISAYDSAFLTNTSGKIVPIRKIDAMDLKPIPESMKNLMRWYDEYVKEIHKK
ncbi:MAG: aminotransferase class IV [Patescibacteria group bacterium]